MTTATAHAADFETFLADLTEFDAVIELCEGFGIDTESMYAEPDRLMKPGYVYFARHPYTGIVKIGTSADPTSRLRSVSHTARVRCELLGAFPWHDGRGLERMLHQELADYWTHGEWFRLTDAHVAHIRDCASRTEAPCPV